MRKKIISYLYACKYVRWMLPLFHSIIGECRLSMGKNNIVNTSNALLFRSHVRFGKNSGNEVLIGKDSDFHNSRITIKGNNNTVHIGEGCYINGVDLIVEGDSNRITIGNNVFFLDDTRIYVVDGSAVIIGDGCMFSDHIEIRTTDNHAIYDECTKIRINKEQDVILGAGVWCGMRVIILKGVELAEGCIVGAGSVVTRKHLTPHAVIAGNPARVIKENVSWTMAR